VIRRSFHTKAHGVDVIVDVNATVASTSRDGTMTEASSTSDPQIVQRGRGMPKTGPSDRRGHQGEAHMADDAITQEELAAQTGEELPDREAMSLVNANIAAPINAAVALNALSDGSTAVANATQTAPITQTT